MIEMSDTHTATVDAAEFYQAVANASLFASADDTLPLICSVHICQGDPGFLRFEATNRYIASQERLRMIDREQDSQPYISDRGSVIRHLRDDHGYPPEHDFTPLETMEQATAEHNAKHQQDAGHTHVPATTPVTGLDIIVRVKGLLKVTKMLKQLEDRTGAVPQPRIVIEWAEGSSHASFTLTDQASEPDQTLRAEVIDTSGYSSSFPRLGRFFDTYRDQPASTPGLEDPEPLELLPETAIAAKWLAVLSKVATGGKEPTVRLSLGLQTKPVIAEIGSRFRAVVIPMKGVW